MNSRAFSPHRLAIGLFLICFAFLGFTSAPASAAPVKSKVIIDKIQNQLYGYVRSGAPKRCSAHRQIKVLKIRNGNGTEVGTGRTSKYGSKAWQWSLKKKSGAGKYVAWVLAKRGCAADVSRPIKIAPQAGTRFTECTRSGLDCWIGTPDSDKLYFFTFPRSCPSLADTGTAGNCNGEASRGSAAFGNNQDASIIWTHFPGRINFIYRAANDSTLQGFLPDAGSDRFSIEDGHIGDGGKEHLCTPDLPGVRAGDPGGPINLDFENEIRGAEVYFYGVVTSARSTTEC